MSLVKDPVDTFALFLVVSFVIVETVIVHHRLQNAETRPGVDILAPVEERAILEAGGFRMDPCAQFMCQDEVPTCGAYLRWFLGWGWRFGLVGCRRGPVVILVAIVPGTFCVVLPFRHGEA